MFWGAKVKANQSYKLGESADLQAPLVQVTNAALAAGSKGKAALSVKINGEEYVIAYLDDEKRNTQLELIFRSEQETEFIVKGEAEVHLTGYY